MSELRQADQLNAMPQARPFAELHTRALEARKALLDREEQVKQAIGEVALLQMEVAGFEEEYRSRLETYYLGEELEGRNLHVAGEVDAVVRKNGVWVFEASQVEGLSVFSVRLQHERFNSEIHDIEEFAHREATVVAEDEDGTRYYIPERSVLRVDDEA